MDIPKCPLKVKQLAPENLPGPNRKVVVKNHQFSGGELLNFGGVTLCWQFNLWVAKHLSDWWKSGLFHVFFFDPSLAEGCMPAYSKWHFDSPDGGHQQALKRSLMGPCEVTLKNLVVTYRPPINKFKQFTRILQVSKRVKGFLCSIAIWKGFGMQQKCRTKG